MSISEPFIRKPVATTLLMAGIVLSGVVAYRLLPVSPLPQVDFPTISVSAGLPGASPEIMASAVVTPLERQLGHIAAVTEMSSSSQLGSGSITLQFDLSRDIDAAARDVQAAINAARGNLPANLPNNPSYRKVNPADSPIMLLSLTSPVLSKSKLYDAASTILAQKLSQVAGVGQVTVGGSALPSVRIELNPAALNKYQLGFEQVRAVLGAANANSPKGHLTNGLKMWEVGANDQLFNASDYEPLVIAYRNGTAVRISDVGTATDAPEDLRNAGYSNGKPSVVVIIFRQPAANIIETVDRIHAILPQLKSAIPQSIDLHVVMDQTVTIRASLADTNKTLLIAVGLVILVVFIFLRNWRSTVITSVVVPVSLIGTFAVMYLLGYSLDNLSLMALTISTGFVVDDAIVVIENIARYAEMGMKPVEAAIAGAKEIGSTVFTISVSLVAVFIPLLLMGGIVGRLFREFAVTLSIAIAVSMVISLTATPMMCAHFLKPVEAHGWLYKKSEQVFDWMAETYSSLLEVALRFAPLTLSVLLITIGLNVYLFIHVPKGLFPQQDNGRLQGSILADQDTSFEAMDGILQKMISIIDKDPGVDSVNGFTGGSTFNTARMFISLKPLEERKVTADVIIGRLRPQLSRVPGATMFLQAAQDLRIGGRASNAQYQFVMRGDNLQELISYAPKVLKELRGIPTITDANSDLQNQGLQSLLQYDRTTAARLGVSTQLIDATLYDAYGQRPVSTMYAKLNQYHVVMEVAPQYWQDPEALRSVYVHSTTGMDVPLSAFAKITTATAPLTVTHAGLFPAVTLSFNLRPGAALGDAVDAIDEATTKVGLPASIQTSFAGTAQAYQDSLGNEPYLIAAALLTVYLVLGMLYESYIHPITIISSLPSASVGGLLALMVTNNDLSVIAFIGIILLIGIVKKNAIMMIDFALNAERLEGKNSHDAIFEACMLRFRPILMTTMAALLGAVPLAIGTGTGSELRNPLGIVIIGGLILSQLQTLFTTPVVYLYFDRLQQWRAERRTVRPVAPNEVTA